MIASKGETVEGREILNESVDKLKKETIILMANLKIAILIITTIICFVVGLWFLGLVLFLIAIIIYLYQAGLKRGEEQKKKKT